MNATDFDQFLIDQRESLATIERSLRARETNVIELDDPLARQQPVQWLSDVIEKPLQTQVDDIARRLADVYALCTDEQRSAIRQLMRESKVAQAFMGIPPERIQFKFDDILFRRALIYESMKDLRSAANVSLRRLDDLCAAAQKAKIEINPHLRHVAERSSTSDHSGRGSMRQVLLACLTADDGSMRCKRCGQRFDAELPACPHCGEPNPSAVSLQVRVAGTHGEIGEAYGNNEMLIYLSTQELLWFIALLVMWVAIVILPIIQLLKTLNTVSYHDSAEAWIRYGLMASLFAALRYSRSVDQFTKYARIRSHLAFTGKQVLVLIPVGVILFALFAYLAADIDSSMGH